MIKRVRLYVSDDNLITVYSQFGAVPINQLINQSIY